MVAAVSSLWWPIQGKPWRGSLSRPEPILRPQNRTIGESYTAREGELRDRTAITIPVVPFLYYCLLFSPRAIVALEKFLHPCKIIRVILRIRCRLAETFVDDTEKCVVKALLFLRQFFHSIHYIVKIKNLSHDVK